MFVNPIAARGPCVGDAFANGGGFGVVVEGEETFKRLVAFLAEAEM